MTKGDNLIGIPTTYKGIAMRSKLETKVAMFLDALDIKWVYEPKPFLLSNGIPYVPDFYLTELDCWLEVKGVIEEHNKEISKLFAEENETEIIIISSDKQYFCSTKDYEVGEASWDKGIQLVGCSKCDKYSFTSCYGSFHCRCCGNHEGDHDLVAGLGEVWGDEIDFSDINSIKRWLKNVRTSI